MHSLLYGSCPSDQRVARRLVGSPHPASFRFAVTCSTLAFGYIRPTTGWIRDLHPLETCAARRTIKKHAGKGSLSLRVLQKHSYFISSFCFSFIRLRRSLFIHHCIMETNNSSNSSPTSSVVGPSLLMAYKRYRNTTSTNPRFSLFTGAAPFAFVLFVSKQAYLLPSHG